MTKEPRKKPVVDATQGRTVCVCYQGKDRISSVRDIKNHQALAVTNGTNVALSIPAGQVAILEFNLKASPHAAAGARKLRRSAGASVVRPAGWGRKTSARSNRRMRKTAPAVVWDDPIDSGMAVLLHPIAAGPRSTSGPPRPGSTFSTLRS